MIRTIGKNVLSNWAGLAVSMAIAFFMSPFIVRTLGDAQYGVWILILSVTGYMGLLDMGLKVSIVKYVAANSAAGDADTLSETVSTALGVYSVVAVVLVLTAVVLSQFVNELFEVPRELQEVAQVVLVIAGMTLAANLFFSVFNGFVAGLQRYEIVNGVGIALSIVGALAIWTSLSAGAGLVGIALINLSVQFISGAILWRTAGRLRPDVKIRLTLVRPARVKELYSYSVFVLMNSMAMLLLFRSGELLAGALLGAASVTYFAIGAMLVEYLAKIVGTMTQVLHPLASGQFARGESENLRQVVLLSTRACLVIALPASIGFVVLGSAFIGAWMGEKYSVISGSVLSVLAIGRLFWLAQSGAGNIMLGAGMHKALSTLTATTGVLGIVLAAILGSRYGLIGIAVGLTSAIVIFQGVGIPVTLCRRMRIGYGEYFRGAVLGPVLASVPFSIVLHIFVTYSDTSGFKEVLGAVALSGPCYLVAAYFLCLDRQQRGLLWSWLMR